MLETLEITGLELLRGCLDLAAADVRPTPDLLGRLTALDAARVGELVDQLRDARLLQPDGLGLTMEGLAIAAGLPELEPAPMAEPQVSPFVARTRLVA